MQSRSVLLAVAAAFSGCHAVAVVPDSHQGEAHGLAGMNPPGDTTSLTGSDGRSTTVVGQTTRLFEHDLMDRLESAEGFLFEEIKHLLNESEHFAIGLLPRQDLNNAEKQSKLIVYFQQSSTKFKEELNKILLERERLFLTFLELQANQRQHVEVPHVSVAGDCHSDDPKGGDKCAECRIDRAEITICAEENGNCSSCKGGEVRFGSYGLGWQSDFPHCDMFTEWKDAGEHAFVCQRTVANPEGFFDGDDPAGGEPKICECKRAIKHTETATTMTATSTSSTMTAAPTTMTTTAAAPINTTMIPGEANVQLHRSVAYLAGLKSPATVVPRSPAAFVAQSGLENAGRGVFAARDIAPCERIETAQTIDLDGYPHGTVMAQYVFKHPIDSNKSVIALGMGSLYNHAGKDANVRYRSYAGRTTMDFFAARAIKAGQELFINYGYSPRPLGAHLWQSEQEKKDFEDAEEAKKPVGAFVTTKEEKEAWESIVKKYPAATFPINQNGNGKDAFEMAKKEEKEEMAKEEKKEEKEEKKVEGASSLNAMACLELI